MKWEVKGGKGNAERNGMEQHKTAAYRRSKALVEVV
jgi:hypothetical protein